MSHDDRRGPSAAVVCLPAPLMRHFIDSHAHLADPAFDVDREAVIDRARAAGACKVVCIGESLARAARAAELARAYPELIAFTAGVHPHDAAGWDTAHDAPAIAALMAAGAVAVGECGLDYHYDNAPRDHQRRAFAAQVAIAAATRRPVVVHTRDAEDDTRDALRDAAAQGVLGVLHCYTGSAALAEAALSVGWYVSFSGIVTFRSWTDLDVLRLVPTDRLLVESDSPYLAPVPHRGRRNEPAWVPATIERLAAVRATTVQALADATSANAARLFGLAWTSEERV